MSGQASIIKADIGGWPPVNLLMLTLLIITIFAFIMCAIITFIAPTNSGMIDFWMEIAKICLSFIIGVLTGYFSGRSRLEKDKIPS